MAIVTEYIVGQGAGSWTPRSTATCAIQYWGAGQAGDDGTGNGGIGGAWGQLTSFSATAGTPVAFNLGAPGVTSAQAGGNTWFSAPGTALAPGGGSATSAVGNLSNLGGIGGAYGGGGIPGGGGAGGPNGAGKVGGTGPNGGGGAGGGASNGGSVGSDNVAGGIGGAGGNGTGTGGVGGTSGSLNGGAGGKGAGGGGGYGNTTAGNGGNGGDDYDHGGGGGGGSGFGSGVNTNGGNGGTPGGGGATASNSGSIGRGGYGLIKITYTGTDADRIFALFPGLTSQIQIPSTWTNNAKGEYWGGGAGGGTGAAGSSAGGGGAGTYSRRNTVTVTAGGTLSVTGGAGGAAQVAGGTTTVGTTTAPGGGTTSTITAGAAGSAGANADTTNIGGAGGAGLAAAGDVGGGGAGAGGPDGAGVAGSAGTATQTTGSGGRGDNSLGGLGGATAGAVNTAGRVGASNQLGGGGGSGSGGSSTAKLGGGGGWPGGGGGGGGGGATSNAGGAGADGLILLTSLLVSQYTFAAQAISAQVSSVIKASSPSSFQRASAGAVTAIAKATIRSGLVSGSATASVVRSVRRLVSATASRVASIGRSVSRFIFSTQNPLATISAQKVLTRTILAVAAALSSASRSAPRLAAATSNVVLSSVRSSAKSAQAQSATVVLGSRSLGNRIAQALAAQTAFLSNLRIQPLFSALTSPVAASRKAWPILFGTFATQTSLVVRFVAKSGLSALSTASAGMVRLSLIPIGVFASSATSSAKATTVPLQAAGSLTSTQSRLISKLPTVSSTPVVTRILGTVRVIQASAASVISSSRAMARASFAMASAVIYIQNAIGVTRTSSQPPLASIGRVKANLLGAFQQPTSALIKGIARSVQGVSSPQTSRIYQAARSFSVSAFAALSNTRAVGAPRNSVSNATAGLFVGSSKQFLASSAVSSVPALSRLVRKLISGRVSALSAFGRLSVLTFIIRARSAISGRLDSITSRASGFSISEDRVMSIYPLNRLVSIKEHTLLVVYPFDPKYASDTDGFTFDLTAWIGDNDQLAGTPTASITPSDITLEGVAVSGGIVTVWISGGTAGQKYTIELRAVTQGAPGGTHGRDCRVRGSFTVVA